MSAIAQILKNLEVKFADLDAEVLEASIAWGKARRDDIKAFRASDEYQAIRSDAWALYAKLHALAGGKTWYNLLAGECDERIEEVMTKNHNSTIAARNVRIAKALDKAGVTEVLETTYTQTADGFDGVFVVNTNAGKKAVTVNTIRAGGYNIQCLHLRVLVKVK